MLLDTLLLDTLLLDTLLLDTLLLDSRSRVSDDSESCPTAVRIVLKATFHGRRSRRERSGYALVILVMLFFAICGVAALVIDMGFARLAQRQMASATDAAALEAMRFRDDAERIARAMEEDAQLRAQIEAACGAAAPADAAWRDCVRRWSASQVAEWIFDDDFDATGDARNFGAGPAVELSGGVSLNGGEFRASQQLAVSESPTYDPDLQLNTSNAGHGDMVAGSFFAGGPNQEDANYTRPDFQPAAGSAAAPGSFLVRMRRTDRPSALDAQSGVSSHGPAVPFLFGRAALMALDARGRGITVRATSIASAAPAKWVGADHSNRDLLGATSIAISAEVWNDASRWQPVNGSADLCEATFSVGGELKQVAERPVIIGDAVSELAALVQPAATQRYVVLFDAGLNAVIGFADAEALAVQDSTSLRVVRRCTSESGGLVFTASIAPRNTLATIPADAAGERFRSRFAQDPQLLASVLEEHRALPAALLSPVVGR